MFLARRLNGSIQGEWQLINTTGPVRKDFLEGTYLFGDDTRKPSWLTFAPEPLLTPVETLHETRSSSKVPKRSFEEAKKL